MAQDNKNKILELERREKELLSQLHELERKHAEMENWIQRLGEATSQITAGDYTAHLPDSPPEKIYQQVTSHMEQMQAKLGQYFSNLLLKDRLSSLGILASGIAHELNTPLTTIQFILHSDTHLPEDSKALLVGEVDRMSKITRDLLSFARPSTEEVFDLNKAIERAQPLVRTDNSRSVQIDFMLEKNPIHIKGVSNQIQQIIFNLIHNSLDATEKVKDARIEVKTTIRNDGVAILSISDNGEGIEKQNLQKILDPFFTTKSPGKGTGLGLFVVHQIIQKHDGVLAIESEKGKGTTVKVMFLCKNETTEKAA